VEHHRRKARFFSTVDLVNMLEQEKAMNKAGQLDPTPASRETNIQPGHFSMKIPGQLSAEINSV